MKLNHIVIGDYKGKKAYVQYRLDLPVTFTDKAFFIDRVALDDLLNYLREEGIIRIGEWRAFRSDKVKIGHLSIDGVYWECMAVYDSGIEQYHVIRTQSLASKALSVKDTLFRFHSGKTVYESVKDAYTIRDGSELRNIIKAAGFVGDALEVKPYGFDKRINWLTHLVTIDGKAIGYTNQPVYIEEPIHE